LTFARPWLQSFHRFPRCGGDTTDWREGETEVTRVHDLLYSSETLKLEALTTPINKLGYTIEGSFLEEAIRVVRRDMKRVGITQLKPLYYLSNGYGCIEGFPNISLSFIDCDPLIAELNHEFRRFVYTPQDVIDTVRHEVGHAFCYAYKLFRTAEFRRTFRVKGHFFRTYPVTDRYIKRVNPWSREYVNPGGDHYAQKHPDDDFAETFMVWLKPRQNWRRKYKSRPGALRKLEYVDRVARKFGRKPPLVESDENFIYEPIEDLTMTLAKFFKADPGVYRRKATGYVDPDLKNMFLKRPAYVANGEPSKAYQQAHRFLSANRVVLTTRIADWVDIDRRVVAAVLGKLVTRSRTLELWMRRNDADRKLIEITAYVSSLCTTYAHRGVFFPKKR
jgi:hypothetical protein